MNIFKRQNIDMINGPLLGKIIKYVLPLMLTNLMQVLYNATDMVVVGLSNEPDSVGAIGTTGAMINLILNVFMGFSVGVNVKVAQHIGAGDKDKVSKAVHTAVATSILCGIGTAVLGYFISTPILSAMGNTGKLLELSSLYTRIYFIGTPLMALSNFTIAVFRAKGDTQTPLMVLLGSGLLNVCLNLFFVLVLDMSVDGVAIATAIANGASAIILLIILARANDDTKFSIKKLGIDKKSFVEMLLVGIPAGIQGALFSFSNMIIQSSIIKVNNLLVPEGSGFQPIVKGNASAGNLEGFLYTSTNSVYQAAVTFTGQNVGAKKYDRVSNVQKCTYFVTFCVAVFFSLTIILLRKQLLGLYGVVPGEAGSLEEMAYNTAIIRINYMFILYFFLAFMEIGSGILRGLGKSFTSTVISLVGACFFRLVWIWTVFNHFQTLESIYLSYPISWFLTALVSFIVGMRIKNKLIKSMPKNA